MRVTKRNARETTSPDAKRPPAFPLLLQISLLLLVFLLGFAVAQQSWYRPFLDVVGGLVRHPSFTVEALLRRPDTPVLTIDLGFAEYQRLLDRREQALRLGANTGSSEDAVQATIRAAGPAVDVLLRLPEGPGGGLAGASWPFEVAVGGGEMVLDMSRFTLTPADESFLSTWGYLTSLRRAGVLAPRAELVRLTLNGTDWGLYVLEEVPTAEWLRTQGRGDSVVVAFDASAYWDAVARLGDAVPGSGFQYARVTGGPSCAEEDAARAATCEAATDLLRRLRDAEIAPSAALDSERMASLVAQTALWRGSMALDWSSLRFAYNPSSGRLEPIATAAVMPETEPVPDTLTADPALQAATVEALAAVARPEAVSRLQADLAADLAPLQLALGAEMGYVPLPWQALETHRGAIQRQLAPDRPLLVVVDVEDDALVLRVGNPQPFPVEIIGVDVGESAFLAADLAWVDEMDRSALVEGADLVLRGAAGSQAPSLRLRVPSDAFSAPVSQTPDTVRLTTRLYGLDVEQVVEAAWEGEGGGP